MWRLVTSQGVHSVTWEVPVDVQRPIRELSQVSDETQLPARSLPGSIGLASQSHAVKWTIYHCYPHRIPDRSPWEDGPRGWAPALWGPMVWTTRLDCCVPWKVVSNGDKSLEKRVHIEGSWLPKWQLGNTSAVCVFLERGVCKFWVKEHESAPNPRAELPAPNTLSWPGLGREKDTVICSRSIGRVPCMFPPRCTALTCREEPWLRALLTTQMMSWIGNTAVPSVSLCAHRSVRGHNCRRNDWEKWLFIQSLVFSLCYNKLFCTKEASAIYNSVVLTSMSLSLSLRGSLSLWCGLLQECWIKETPLQSSRHFLILQMLLFSALYAGRYSLQDTFHTGCLF